MKRMKLLLIGLIVICASPVFSAINIGIVQEPGTTNISVFYTATSEYSSAPFNIWNSQAFTLRWPSSVGMSVISSISNSAAYSFAVDGGVIDGGDGFFYQKYTAIGTGVVQNISSGVPLEVMSIITTGATGDVFELIENAWTSGNNGTPSVNNVLGEQFNMFDMPTVTLPISLDSFQAEKSGNSAVALEWITANEVNSDHFEVERSVDGAKWQFIGQVAANGNSSEQIKYTHLDSGLDIASVNRFYYRLKLVDMDGSYDYSAVRSVDFVGNKNGKASFSVYPNPTNEAINISLIDVKEDSKVSLNVYDMGGKLIHSEIMSTVNDNNVSVSDWSIGSYNAIISIDNKELLSKKILVQK